MLLPALLLLLPCVDVALRYALPPEALGFRGWDQAMLDRTWPAPLATNFVFRTERSWGDLSNLSNRSDLRAYRPDSLVTDELGCRNDPAWARERRIDALFLGSSFGAGTGQRDDETIEAQLGRRTRLRIYNAAGSANTPRELLIRLRDHFAFRRGPVFREVLMRTNVMTTLGGRPPAPPPDRRWFPRGSPLKLTALRLLRRLEDDRWLPNPARAMVALRDIAGSGPTLFLTADFPVPPVPVRDDLTDWLVAEGYRPVIVLIPTKYQAMRPLLAGESPADGPHERAIGQIERAYRSAGYTVVNVFPALRAAAMRAPMRTYWPDDSHLSPDGARVVGDEIARLWHPSSP